MNEEVEMLLDEAQENMHKAILHLDHELLKIRAGRATTDMIDGVTIEYYGAITPLTQVANVTTPDARTIAIQPWEKNIIPAIERAILQANLGFNPQNNGEIIRINVPVLTEERRKDFVKKAHAAGEHAKISIRTQRREVNDYLKKMQKEGLSEDVAKSSEEKVQKMTDEHVALVDKKVDAKEKDIMKV